MTGILACDDCLSLNCCAENLACDIGTDCDNLTTCIGTCAGDPNCESACTLQFPNGLNDYNARATCITSFCSMECTPAGICDSGLTTQIMLCDQCLATNCCAEFDACTGGMNGANMAMLMACLTDCGLAQPGPLCAAAIACETNSCIVECM